MSLEESQPLLGSDREDPQMNTEELIKFFDTTIQLWYLNHYKNLHRKSYSSRVIFSFSMPFVLHLTLHVNFTAMLRKLILNEADLIEKEVALALCTMEPSLAWFMSKQLIPSKAESQEDVLKLLKLIQNPAAFQGIIASLASLPDGQREAYLQALVEITLENRNELVLQQLSEISTLTQEWYARFLFKIYCESVCFDNPESATHNKRVDDISFCIRSFDKFDYSHDVFIDTLRQLLASDPSSRKNELITKLQKDLKGIKHSEAQATATCLSKYSATKPTKEGISNDFIPDDIIKLTCHFLWGEQTKFTIVRNQDKNNDAPHGHTMTT